MDALIKNERNDSDPTPEEEEKKKSSEDAIFIQHQTSSVIIS